MSWPRKNLGDIVDFLSGFAWKAANFSDDRSGVPIIRIQNVDSVRESDFVYWVDEYDSRFIVKEGDLLLTLSGSFRAEFWTGPDALLNQRIVKITPKSDIDRNWLMHSLRGALAQIEAMGRHALVNNVALSDLRQMQLSVPPLEEQKRIAAILDQADDIRRKRQHAIDRLNQLGQAIFYEMFGDKAASKEGHVKLGQISERVTKGESPKWQGHSYVDDGALFVTSENVGWGTLLEKEPKFVPLEFHNGKLARSKLKQYDILINLVGASIGRACIFNGEHLDANINQAVSVVTLNKNYKIQNYVLSYILSHWGQEQILGSRVEGARANISLQDVREFSLYLPSADEAAQFDERIGALVIMQQQNMLAIEQSKNLFASLQHRAFTGQL